MFVDMWYTCPMSKEDDLYMAGLLDGEGTIGIAFNTGKNRSPYISVTSTTYEIVQWLVKTYGGHIVKQKVYKDHHKQSWCWKISRKDLVFNVIDRVVPLMKEPEKVRRGMLIRAEYDLVTMRNGKYTPEQAAAKQDFEVRVLVR